MTNTADTRTLVVKTLLQSDLSSLGKLLNSQAVMAVENTDVWIRYNSEDEHAVNVASCLTGRRFRLLDNNLLVPLGSTVATERLPKLEWQGLAQVLQFRLPMAALSGRLTAPQLPQLKLIRGGVERPAAAGVYSLEELLDWVVAAPQFRLQKLAACVSEREVLVFGNPLPPIACKFLCLEGRLLTPAGMTWYPRISAGQVLEHFDVAADQIFLWTNNEQWSTIPTEYVRPLRRASIRAFVDKQWA